MDPNTYRDDDDPDQPETYWRRRAATLVAGLGVLGLLAWAFSSSGGKPASAASQTSPPSGTLSAVADPSASAFAAPTASASASAGADAALPGLARSGLPKATTSAKAKAGARASSSSAKSAVVTSTAQATTGVEPDGRCSPSAVVLSVFSSIRSFPAGQDPQFGVDAVSTASSTCTFDLSPAALDLVVMSSGRVIWDSADCGHSGGGRLSKLSRGVPVQQTFTWNRTITLPGCVTLASSARPGSYTAQARTTAIASGVFSFRLR